MRIAVKYCGNCNPEIDSPRIIARWMETTSNDEITFHPEGKAPADLLVIICGCRKGCVDRPEVRTMGKQVILIKGRWMDGLSCPENELGHQLLQRVESIKGVWGNVKRRSSDGQKGKEVGERCRRGRGGNVSFRGIQGKGLQRPLRGGFSGDVGNGPKGN